MPIAYQKRRAYHLARYRRKRTTILTYYHGWWKRNKEAMRLVRKCGISVAEARRMLNERKPTLYKRP
jgi:hypothetical protein